MYYSVNTSYKNIYGKITFNWKCSLRSNLALEMAGRFF